MYKNTSSAVMAQRKEPLNSIEDYPTPPWATRALLEYVIPPGSQYKIVLEPACGRGHMSRVLSEYYSKVVSTDIEYYEYNNEFTDNFLESNYEENSYDWVITNPPFKYAEAFILKARPIAKIGVAMLLRTVFIESVGRWKRLFSVDPPKYIAQFSERVAMVKGKLDRKAQSATSYAWFVWTDEYCDYSRLVWIPPCRKELEYKSDYAVE